MDSRLLTLGLDDLTRIRISIPYRSPTRDYLNAQEQQGYDRGLSVEGAMREALLSAFRSMEHNWVVYMAVVTDLEENVEIQHRFTLRGTLAPQAPPPPSQPALCGHCRGPIVDAWCWNDVDYCSSKCSHDAGDRRRCRRGCGCTGFALKRRQLRDMRNMMRAMKTVIDENELWDELDDELQTTLGLRGNSLATLDSDSEMDEGSDAEDPMVTQANEIGAVSDIVQLSRNMVELAELRRGQKRARSEDQGA